MSSGFNTSSEFTVTSILAHSSRCLNHTASGSAVALSSSAVFSTSLGAASAKELSSTSDPPVVKTPNLPELPSTPSSPLTMSSTPTTTGKADGQADTPSTTGSSSTSSGSESSTKGTSKTSSNSVSPRTSQSSVTSNTTRSTTTSSLATSTTTSVVFAKGTQPSTTVVSTITESPESTLKSAVGVVITQSDGRTTVSFPPVVTVLSTSLLPNGSYVTFTHAMANPTGADQANESNTTKGFLQNHGAVAGVFLAVGVILASLIGCVFILMRRQRRKRSQSPTQRWIEDMQTPRYTDDPFEDHPQMTAVDSVSMRSPDRFQLDDGGPLIPLTPTYQTLMTSPVQRKQPPVDDGPFSDSKALSPIVGDDGPIRPRTPLQVSRQSTPSLYPPTDKDEYEDIELDDSVPPARARSVSYSSANTSRPTSAEITQSGPTIAPPRPPRSILRIPSKVYEPYTPPPSDSNHSSSDSPTSLRSISKAIGEDVLTRPTLLNVRPRSKGQ